MCYNTRQDIPQSFMIFGVPKVFILHFTKSPKIPCMSVLSTRRSTVRSTDVFIWELTENSQIWVLDAAGDRSTDRSTDLLCIGRPAGRPMARFWASQRNVKTQVFSRCVHRSTGQSTDPIHISRPPGRPMLPLGQLWLQRLVFERGYK
jgi:hypothetical protein